MKKVVAAVFAHPDDEAFGPGGTLALLSQKSDVYLITATGGEAGKNSSEDTNHKLSQIRRKELLSAAKVLGIKKVYFLGFVDGSLCNALYHKIASNLEEVLRELKPTTVITFEPRGISGHIDHIAISFITTYVTKKLSSVKKLLYYCVLEKYNSAPKDYFIHYPKGYSKDQIQVEFDIESVFEIKRKAMLKHKSQAHDAKRILKNLEKRPKKEYFIATPL